MKINNTLDRLVKEAYDFGSKLGVMENVSFEDFRGRVNPSRIEKAYKAQVAGIPRTIAYGKMVHFRPEVIKANVWLAEHARERMLGLLILDIAKTRDLLLETVASWPELGNDIFSKLKKIVPVLKAQVKFQELINKYFRRLKIVINGKEYDMIVDNHHPFELAALVNTTYEKELGNKIFVEVKDAVGLGFLLINKQMVKYEKNPFIPFFYKNHPELINRAIVDKD